MAATIRTRKRGKTYSYSFDIGKDPATGKRKMKEKGGFESDQAAFDAGTEAYSDWKHGDIGIISEKVSLENYLDSWLENVSRPNTKRKCYDTYSGAIKRIKKFTDSDVFLQDFKPRNVDSMVKEMARYGYAKGTILYTKSVLSNAMNYAVYPAELIRSNPCTGISLPKNVIKKVIKREIISDEKMRDMLEKYPPGHKYHIVLLLLYCTGMRISEAIGLEWSSVDFENKKIAVVQQVEEDMVVRGRFFDTPKNEASNREFYIDNVLFDALKKWKAIQSADELKMGTGYQVVYEDAQRNLSQIPKIYTAPDYFKRKFLVCTDQYGRSITYRAIQCMLKKLGTNSHSFRHTHATKLLECGAKPIDIADRLGHADSSMVDKLYGHDTDKMKMETAEIFEQQSGKLKGKA